jgi:hypothetical protein
MVDHRGPADAQLGAGSWEIPAEMSCFSSPFHCTPHPCVDGKWSFAMTARTSDGHRGSDKAGSPRLSRTDGGNPRPRCETCVGVSYSVAAMGPLRLVRQGLASRDCAAQGIAVSDTDVWLLSGERRGEGTLRVLRLAHRGRRFWKVAPGCGRMGTAESLCLGGLRVPGLRA